MKHFGEFEPQLDNLLSLDGEARVSQFWLYGPPQPGRLEFKDFRLLPKIYKC